MELLKTPRENNIFSELKIMYFYVIEVADFESDLGLCNGGLEENALRRPPGHLHLVPNNACPNSAYL